MMKAQILLKMAQLKRDYASKELQRMYQLVKEKAISEEACEEAELRVSLAQCEVELAELECKET